MSAVYSSKKQKFREKTDEDWLTKLSRYQFKCSQNKVSGNGRITHLHCMLDGAALHFFINDIEGKITNWGEVVRRFHKRYDSAAKQDYISNRLDELNIPQFETGDDVTESMAFGKIIDELDRLTLMSHPEDRTDQAKMLHLQQAIIGREWAKTVLSNVSASVLSYHTLIELLEYTLLHQLKYDGVAKTGAAGSNSHFRMSRWKWANFAG